VPAVKDARGGFVQQRGISPVPRLYFIGRSWQQNRGSALLTGVGDDAADIARHVTRDLHQPAHASLQDEFRATAQARVT
jgi:putative flavoprotein involved in K+ transport